MKHLLQKAMLGLCAVLCFTHSFAQQHREPTGGGVFEPERAADEMTSVQRDAIWREIRQNQAALIEQGLLSSSADITDRTLTVQPLFDWPTAQTQPDPGYYGISNFVDQNPAAPGSLQDYNCGERTYDLDSGYNHQGIDIFSWPYPWLKMDQNAVQIVAGQGGVIVAKYDGNADRNCGFGGANWNAVYVQHADNSIAWYGHMKSGSLTSKNIGQSVTTGEVLGVMGSSGSSTGPHLHFEVYDDSSMLVEPFYGACNAMNDFSWWEDQQDYYQPGINMLATHDAVPVMDNGCGVTETPNFSSSFQSGDTVYAAVYLRDQLQGDEMALAILQPDGTVYDSWTSTPTISGGHYAGAWWYWIPVLPNVAQPGNWKWRVTFNGQIEEVVFTVDAGGEVFEDGFEN